MRIVVVGGGNATHVFSVLSAHAGHQVSVLTRKPEKWSATVSLASPDHAWLPDLEYPVNPTSDFTVVREADVIILCGIPVYKNREMLNALRAYLPNKPIHIGTITAFGAFDWVASDIGNHKIFGFQLIPWACRAIEYGKSARVLGAKRFVRFAQMEHDPWFRGEMQNIVKVELTETDFLTSTLWPNSPSLHSPLLYAYYKDWDCKTPRDISTLPAFLYGDVTEEGARYVDLMDKERLAIGEALQKKFPSNRYLRELKPITECMIENYGERVRDQSNTKACIATWEAFSSAKLPYKSVPGGAIPDLEHRIFVDDIYYGLCVFKYLALYTGVPTPVLDEITMWNQKLIGKEFLINGQLVGKDMVDTPCVFAPRVLAGASSLPLDFTPLVARL